MINEITFRRTQGTKDPRKVSIKRTEGSGTTTFAQALDQPTETTTASAAPPVADLSALLTIQDSTAERRQSQAYVRAESILEQLQRIHQGLALGMIPKEALERLQHLVTTTMKTTTDPKLLTIAREIEARARVELAKLEKLGE